MNSYPSMEDYLKLYKLEATDNGFQVDEEIAISLIEDLQPFLDMVYDLGKLEKKK